jgi:insertion element IS1 protein InsB
VLYEYCSALDPLVSLTQITNSYQGGSHTVMLVREVCPACGSQPFKTNGPIHHGKHNHHCKACGRQCVLLATQRLVPTEDRALVERLLCEKISLHGICRLVGVSIRWLMDFVSARLTAVPDHLSVQPATSPHAVIIQRLDVEADEMCSFVEKQANKPWLWLAMDATTRQVMAFHGGDRSRKSVAQLWPNIPVASREQAIWYTDQYEAYQGVIPAARPKAIPKNAWETNHIERVNNALRPRVSRLVGDTLAFSKKLEYHIGTIQYFICHDNLTRAAAVRVSHYQIPHVRLAPQGAGSSEWRSKMCVFHRL